MYLCISPFFRIRYRRYNPLQHYITFTYTAENTSPQTIKVKKFNRLPRIPTHPPVYLPLLSIFFIFRFDKKKRANSFTPSPPFSCFYFQVHFHSCQFYENVCFHVPPMQFLRFNKKLFLPLWAIFFRVPSLKILIAILLSLPLVDDAAGVLPHTQH